MFLAVSVGGGEEDYRRWLGSASSAAPCPAPHSPTPAQAPVGIQLSCYSDEKTEAPERRRGSLKSQSESGRAGIWSQTAASRATHIHVYSWRYSLSTRPREQLGFGEIPVLQLPGPHKWAQDGETTNSFICALTQAAWYIHPLHPPFSCWPQDQDQRSWAKWKVGPWKAQGTGLAALGNQSQPSNPFASLGCHEKKPHRTELQRWLILGATLATSLKKIFSHPQACSFLPSWRRFQQTKRNKKKGLFHTVYIEQSTTFFLILGLFAAKVSLCLISKFARRVHSCVNSLGASALAQVFSSVCYFSLIVPTDNLNIRIPF